MVEHLSANPKGTDSILGRDSYRGHRLRTDMHISCILLLVWSTIFKKPWLNRFSPPLNHNRFRQALQALSVEKTYKHRNTGIFWEQITK